MSQFVESLFRLYKADRITRQQIDNLLYSQKINQNEYTYIVSANNAT